VVKRKGIIITPDEMHTSGVGLDDVEPLEYMTAIASQMRNMGREFAVLRQRLNNIEIEMGMVKETTDQYHSEVKEIKDALGQN